MAYIKFNETEQVIKASVSPVSSNVISIATDHEPVINGFTHYLDADLQYPLDKGEYEGYTTLYRQGDGWYELSNDGSVYVVAEPELPEVYEPTEEELQAAFEKKKEAAVLNTKNILAQYLEDNPLLSNAHGGKEGLYSVTTEKQTLMMSQYMTYQIEKMSNPDAVLTWNETGKACEVWTEAEFLQLVLEVKNYVYPKVSHQQELEERINACATEEELDLIVIDYTEV